MDEVIYINRGLLKNNNDENKNIYVRIDFPDELLAEIWNNFNWELAEKRLFDLQCKISKICLSNLKYKWKKISYLQEKLVNSFEFKMVAIREVSEIKKSTAGIDNVRWKKASEKFRAAITLNSKNYHAKPFRHFEFEDIKSKKKRHIGIPCMYDRAMLVLYGYSLLPVSEALADRKSFAFRKGRTSIQAHVHLCKALQEKEFGGWVLIADIKSYYNEISHKWLIENIPMNKKVLKEFLNSGLCFENGQILSKDLEKGISLGTSISPILRKYDIR